MFFIKLLVDGKLVSIISLISSLVYVKVLFMLSKYTLP